MTSPLEVAGQAVMKVLSVGNQSRRFVGTAFAVNDHFVLTCRHVVQNPMIGGQLVLDGGDLGDVGLLKWFKPKGQDLDVALGITRQPTFRDWLTPACVNVAALKTPITCVGYGSEDRGLEHWQDHVAGEVRRYGLVTVQNTLHKGCSGGPVLNDAGRPVAISVARHQDGAAKYILPVRSFYAWMQECGFRPMEPGREDGAGGFRPMEPGREDGADQPWLLRVPIRPPVPIHKVPTEVVEAFASTFYSEQRARDHLAAANDLAVQSNREGLDERQVTLQVADQPAFDVPRNFWSHVFSVLGSRSRRSVAALLETTGAPNPLVQDESTQRAFYSFRNYLLNAS